jgi:N-acetylglucosamine malate deacetylase 1
MTRLLTPTPPIRWSGPPASGRVLVLAPHPDDETIGVGGTLALHAAAGDPIHVVFLTAGTSGDPTGREDKAAYAAKREREARAACARLGVSAVEFWGFPDNFEVTANDLAAITPRVRELIDRVAPAVIYAPHPGEQHSDHHVAAVILARALATVSSPPPAFGFEVWSASQASIVVDVSSVYETKLAALRCYASQLEHTDIERFISGLNAYRAVFLEKGARYGEAFTPIVPDAGAGRFADPPR